MRIGILGAGNWGTTLALLLRENGHELTLWEFRRDLAERVASERENALYLPGVPLPDDLQVTWKLERAVAGSEMLLFVVPSQVTRGVARGIAQHLDTRPLVVSASKGIEHDTLARMSEVLDQEIGSRTGGIVALLGPSIAREVLHGLPTVVVAASRDAQAASQVQRAFTTERFRVYTNDDLVGVELGVSLKNVIAIAAGLCDGLGYGTNTKAALLTRGLAEITRLGVKLGANPLTFAGLAGVGDLVTTCMSPHSRNRRVGEAIGRGKTLAQVLEEMVMVAEGVETTRSALALAAREGIELPIARQVAEVLFNEKDPRRAVGELMLRAPKEELVVPGTAPAIV